MEPRQWKKSYSYGFLQGDAFRAIKTHLQRDAMKVFSSLVSAHRSRNEPSNVWDGDCKDGDKLLCNRCPLKHEARERKRGEMLYENMSTENTAIGKTTERSTTDVSDT